MPQRRTPALVALTAAGGASILLVAVLAGSAPAAGRQRSATVRVDARDFSFTLSRRSVPAGSSVRFVVRNRGNLPHDFVIRGRRTRLLERGQGQTITVRFPRKGSYGYRCSVAGHAKLGMRGTFAVGARAPAQPPPQPPVTVSGTATLTRIGTFERPVLVTAPPGDPRLFVVNQTGTIQVVGADGQVLPRPFLDIRDRVHFTNEPGLLGLAFAPDYAESGLAYVFYNSRNGNGDLVLAEYRRERSDPNALDPYSSRTVLSIVKPWENHNGGMLQFGPDGDLYISVGDGDSGVLHEPGHFAQTRDDLLGNILRIDPRRGTPYAVPDDNPFVGLDGVRPEIWAYGLRNPWRFWIDPLTNDMYIGDVGEGQREEIDLIPRGSKGLNFGWPCFEGSVPFDTSKQCENPVPPLIDIPHAPDVCAVIGGVVVRDARLPKLAGRYLYSDLCGGRVTAVEVKGGAVVRSDDLGLAVAGVTSFGVDGVGRVYVSTLAGDVYRLDPSQG